MIKRNDEKWVVRLPGSEDVGVFFFGGILWSLQGADCWFRRSSTDETTVGDRSWAYRNRILHGREINECVVPSTSLPPS